MEILRKIEDAKENTVSIHIRRDDYVSNDAANKLMGLLPLTYYEKAIKILEDRFHRLSIFVFSDDIDWVKNNLKVPEREMQKIFFVEGDNHEDYEDMYLMSRCRHHIIANSTFSWWGAWLGEIEDSVIIAPINWFKDNVKDASDVVPNRWMKI